MEKYKRLSITDNLKDYCYLAKEHDFIELTEWHNGEGFDTTINQKIFSLTHGEFKALKKLNKKLFK
jgi:hypothetical protein